VIDAYTIGITLALEDGVSAGIAAIRQDLATFDRAVASTAAGLVALRRLGQQASLITRDDAPPTPAGLAAAARPALGSTAPTPTRAPSANGNPSGPVSDAPGAQLSAGRKMPQGQGPVAPLVDVPRHSVSPIQPLNTRASVAPPLDRFPIDGPGGFQPRPIAGFAPVAPNAPFQTAPMPLPSQPPARAAAASGATTRVSAAPVLVATGSAGADVAAPLPDSGVAPRATRLPRVQVRPAWSDYAPSMHLRSDPVDPPSRARADAPLTQAPSRHAPASFAPPAAELPPEQPEAAPRRAPVDRPPRGPAAGDTDAETPSATMPPSRSEASSASFSGQIVLEGSRLGRWMSDGLTRMTERPPSGSTGVDPRATPGWPGLHGD
jgi:hypothetical protein